MAQQHAALDERLTAFIEAQKIFFVGTAGAEGRVNVSPKGMDSLRVLGPNRVLWLNLTGSGNETAAHLLENGRITIMFCAFEGPPLILRLYGTGRSIHPRDDAWADALAHFPETSGARQVIDVAVDLVQTSCGFGVPLYAYREDRKTLVKWAEKKGDDGLEAYWTEKNQVSLDGKPTGIIE